MYTKESSTSSSEETFEIEELCVFIRLVDHKKYKNDCVIDIFENGRSNLDIVCWREAVTYYVKVEGGLVCGG